MTTPIVRAPRGTLQRRDGSDMDPNSVLLDDIEEVVSGIEDLRLTPDSRFELEVPSDSQWLKDIAYGQVLRREDSDGDVREWRIMGKVESLQDSSVRVSLLPMHSLLRDLDVVRDITAGGQTVWNLGGVGLDANLHLTAFVESVLDFHGITWIRVGIIDSDERFDQNFDGETLLEAVLAYAGQVNGEFALVRRNDRYEIDIRDKLNEDAEEAVISEPHDLSELVMTQSPDSLVTVAIPRGGLPDGGLHRFGCGQATWKVDGTPVAGTVKLAARNGGRGPVLEDGQYTELGTVGDYRSYVPRHFLQKPDGTTTAITASSAANQTVTVDDDSGIAADDDVVIVRDTFGTPVTEIHSPSEILVSGRVVGRIDKTEMRGERNWVRNPFFSAWSGNNRIALALFAGAQSGGTINLDGLPANYSIPAGAVMLRGSEWNQAGVYTRITSAPQTANGSGEVTVTVSPNASGADDAVVLIMDQPYPTAWEDYGGTEPMWFLKVPTDLAPLSATGKVNGTHSGVRSIAVDGFTPGLDIKVGDMFGDVNRSTLNSIVREDVTLNGSGAGTVKVWTPMSFSDNADVHIRRLDYSLDITGRNAVLCGCSLDGTPTATSPGIRCARYTVRHTPGLTRIVAACQFRIWCPDTDSSDAGWINTQNAPKLWLWNRTTNTLINSVQSAAFDPTIDDEDAVRTLITTGTIEADTEVELVFAGPIVTGSGNPGGALAVLLWAGFAMLEGGVLVPVEGSWGTELWQDALNVLENQSTWLATLEGTVTRMAKTWQLDPDDPPPVLGGTVRAVSPTHGLNARARVVGRRKSLTGDEEQLTLSRQPDELVKRVVRIRDRDRYVNLKIIGSGLKNEGSLTIGAAGETTVIQQTFLTQTTPPDQEGALRVRVSQGKDLPSAPPELERLPAS